MSKSTNLSPRRAEVLSLIALVLQTLFFIFAMLIANKAYSLAGRVVAWHFLGGVGIWLILILQFRQRRLALEEHLDVEQYQRLKREGKDTSVFEGSVVEGSLHLAQRRLNWLEKYLLPIFSVLTAVYLLVMGFLLFRTISVTKELITVSPEARDSFLESALYMVLLAVVSFLFSRYASGMSQQSQWRPLRAGGSYLFSNALSCFALAIIFAIIVLTDNTSYAISERIMAYVMVAVMMVIGVEIILNLVLDAFSPRVKGRYRRAAFESRLLGLFSEPGGIMRTAAHAIDYQFGFKVSDTWFYKLLERAVVPLLLIQLLALYVLSCVAIIPPGNVGVLERWGRPTNKDNPLASGIHLKLPWPIDQVRPFPVDRLQVLEIGYKKKPPQVDQLGNKQADMTPILWSKEHWAEEYPILVASGVTEERKTSPAEAEQVELGGPSETSGGVPEKKISGFNMLIVALAVHYRIRDVAQYGYGNDYCYADPRSLIESICNRQAMYHAANSDMETLLGPGSYLTMQNLKNLIQAKVDEYKMGVEIVFVGIESVHPPIEVAPAFEEVISSLQEKQAKILEALGQAQEIMAQAKSESVVQKNQAQAYAFEREVLAKADADRFAHQVTAYEKGRNVYLEREYLSILEEMLPSMRKYVLTSDNVDSWVYEMDMKEKLQSDIFSEIGVTKEAEEAPR
ncbi:MAG: hypothetical protein JXD22_04685 [Sedimentisphaerales bacterium]|nr:hypothetical protein [Sedimentisphaerales bacterium]